MLVTACQSLTSTSPIAGTGPRKLPSNNSLLHAVITLISKEMEQISRTRDLSVLEFSFQMLENCCDSIECRIMLSKVARVNKFYNKNFKILPDYYRVICYNL